MTEVAATIGDFCTDGYLVVRRAVAIDLVRSCVDVIEAELRTRAVDPRDPSTWREPVVRFACPEGPAFAAAGTSPALREMYDALLGAGRSSCSRTSVTTMRRPSSSSDRTSTFLVCSRHSASAACSSVTGYHGCTALPSSVPAGAPPGRRATYSFAIHSWFTVRHGRIAAPGRVWSPSLRSRFASRSRCGPPSTCVRSSAQSTAASSRRRTDCREPALRGVRPRNPPQPAADARSD